MSRHSRRVGRLSQRLGGSPENFEDARLERMTDEEIQAELIASAIEQGFDAEAAAADPYSALSWIEVQARAEFDALPAEKQAEWVAAYGDIRQEPLVWPSDARPTVRDEFRRGLQWRVIAFNAKRRK